MSSAPSRSAICSTVCSIALVGQSTELDARTTVYGWVASKAAASMCAGARIATSEGSRVRMTPQ